MEVVTDVKQPLLLQNNYSCDFIEAFSEAHKFFMHSNALRRAYKSIDKIEVVDKTVSITISVVDDSRKILVFVGVTQPGENLKFEVEHNAYKLVFSSMAAHTGRLEGY